MQRETFSRAQKKSWIRILPPEPALQTHTFWPIGVLQPGELAQYSSDSRFFCTDSTAASNVGMHVQKKLDTDPVQGAREPFVPVYGSTGALTALRAGPAARAVPKAALSAAAAPGEPRRAARSARAALRDYLRRVRA